MKNRNRHRMTLVSASSFSLASVMLSAGCSDTPHKPGGELGAAIGQQWSALIGSEAIGGYAVANHTPCGVTNIPNTVADTQGFLDGLPRELQKNFSMVDATVRARDWTEGTDKYGSGSAATGFAGADASLISYISTHGVTSGARFTMSMGSGGGGGCNIRSDKMVLGNQVARYLFLSTCQSLKIGTGDDPYAYGEIPIGTWSSAAGGLRCIYGYSSNSLDSPDYGTFFWNKLTPGTGITSAFFDASSDIYQYQVPAAMCFGATREAARQELDATMFVSGSNPNTFAVWRWRYTPRPLAPPLPTRLDVRTMYVERQPGSLLPEAKLAAVQDRLRRQALSGESDGHLNYGDEEARLYANRFLMQEGLWLEGRLQPGSVQTESESDSSGRIRNLRKIVLYRQMVAGLPVLGSANQLRVYLDGLGNVTALQDGTVAVSTDSAQPHLLPIDRDAIQARMQDKLLSQLSSGHFVDVPELRFHAESLEIGFDLETTNERGQSPLVYQAVFRVESGGFSKLHKVTLPVK